MLLGALALVRRCFGCTPLGAAVPHSTLRLLPCTYTCAGVEREDANVLFDVDHLDEVGHLGALPR